jgi:hypothetical protein
MRLMMIYPPLLNDTLIGGSIEEQENDEEIQKEDDPEIVENVLVEVRNLGCPCAD